MRLTEEQMEFRLSKNCRVRILFEGCITQEAIEKCIQIIELSRDCFMTEVEYAQELKVNKLVENSPIEN